MAEKEVKERPMTPGERNALGRIIKNTFETLLSELETLRLEAIQEAEREYNDRVNSTRIRRQELHQQVEDKMSVVVATIKDMEAEVAAEGFEVDYDGYRHYFDRMGRSSRISVVDKKHKEMLEARKRDISNQYLKAVQILKRRKLDADKDLLLTAIQTEEAKAFMDSLPDAKSLFALALAA